MEERLKTIMSNLAHVGVISDEAVSAITQIVMNEFGTWRNGIASQLRQKIESWENLEFDNKPSTMSNTALYSLGLRQALDLVIDEKPLEEPPVLETDVEIENINEPPDEDG